MLNIAPVETVEVRTPNAFMDWFADARRGERCQYFRGFLAQWKGKPEVLDKALATKESGELRMLADVVYGMYSAGKVTLVQKRHGFGDYEYFAEKIRLFNPIPLI